MITSFIILLIVFIVLKLLTDFGYIEHNSLLWHSADAAARIILFTYISVQYFGFTHKAYSIAALCLVIFWIAFDMAINLKRHFSVFYVGSGTIDLLVRKIAFRFRIPSEVLMFILKFVILDFSIGYIVESFK